MRHFGFLSSTELDRLFLRRPEPFSAADEPDRVGVGLGATLYCPATRDNLAGDILRRAREGVRSVVVCLEDAIPDVELAAAERNAIAQLGELARLGGELPMIFIRVRAVEQIAMLVAALGDDVGALTGFVVPKFAEDTGGDYLMENAAASALVGRRLLVMPVLENPELTHLETRSAALHGIRGLLDKYREYVPAVRVGAADLSSEYALRRARDLTVWDLRVVADAIAGVVNVFARTDGTGYVVAGPVWEHFPEADLDGLIREVVLDHANGLTGKSVIHPSHVPAVHALSVVGSEEYADACDILATSAVGGARASSYANKMNESKPHTAWARRTITRAQLFGVAREGVGFAELLGAGRRR